MGMPTFFFMEIFKRIFAMYHLSAIHEKKPAAVWFHFSVHFSFQHISNNLSLVYLRGETHVNDQK